MFGEILRGIFDWSEVWALLIPLTVFWKHKPRANWVKPLVWYLLVALVLNLIVDFIWYANMYKWFKGNNNIFYNINSVARVIFFSWFFMTQGKEFVKITRGIIVFFITGAIVLFTFFKNVFFISSILMASEAFLVLMLCLYYFSRLAKEEKPVVFVERPALLVLTGLTLYTTVNLFIFFFYNYLIKYYRTYSVNVWDVHNILLIILCIFIALAFYHESNRK